MCRVVLARLGLKAAALAWLEVASAFSNPRPGQSCQTWLGSGLAWPRPRLLYVNFVTIFFFFLFPLGHRGEASHRLYML